MVNWIYGLFLDLSFWLVWISVVNGYFAFKYRKQISGTKLFRLFVSLFIMVFGANILKNLVPPDMKFRVLVEILVTNCILPMVLYSFCCDKLAQRNPEELFEKIQIVPPVLVLILIIVACFYKHPFICMPV